MVSSCCRAAGSVDRLLNRPHKVQFGCSTENAGIGQVDETVWQIGRGIYVGGVDGRYGTQTQAAVKKLQQQYGIGVDGVVGPQTWSVIDSLENEGPIVS